MKENESLEENAPQTVTTTDEGTMTADDVASHLEGDQHEVPLETLEQLGIGPKTSGGPDVDEKKGGKKGSIFTSPELEYESVAPGTDDSGPQTTTTSSELD